MCRVESNWRRNHGNISRLSNTCAKCAITRSSSWPRSTRNTSSFSSNWAVRKANCLTCSTPVNWWHWSSCYSTAASAWITWTASPIHQPLPATLCPSTGPLYSASCVPWLILLRMIYSRLTWLQCRICVWTAGSPQVQFPSIDWMPILLHFLRSILKICFLAFSNPVLDSKMKLPLNSIGWNPSQIQLICLFFVIAFLFIGSSNLWLSILYGNATPGCITYQKKILMIRCQTFSGETVQRGSINWCAAADNSSRRAGIELDGSRHGHLRRARLESYEGSAGHGSRSQNRPKEGRQRLPTYNPRHPGREDHGVTRHYSFFV